MDAEEEGKQVKRMKVLELFVDEDFSIGEKYSNFIKIFIFNLGRNKILTKLDHIRIEKKGREIQVKIVKGCFNSLSVP